MSGRQVAHAEAMEWEADAIEKCRNDPKVKELGICYVCMTGRHDTPCLCDKGTAVQKMRAYYEAHRRTLFRAEPTAKGSWGVPIDVLMQELYNIATKRYEELRHDPRP